MPPKTRQQQIAETALAGYRVVKRTHTSWPWVAYTANGTPINRYATQKEAWDGAWNILQFRLIATGEP